jgi:hypothetical protein
MWWNEWMNEWMNIVDKKVRLLFNTLPSLLTCNSFLRRFDWRLSSLHSSTIDVTLSPNFWRSSSTVVSVSSNVSWRMAACNTFKSSTPNSWRMQACFSEDVDDWNSHKRNQPLKNRCRKLIDENNQSLVEISLQHQLDERYKRIGRLYDVEICASRKRIESHQVCESEQNHCWHCLVVALRIENNGRGHVEQKSIFLNKLLLLINHKLLFNWKKRAVIWL